MEPDVSITTKLLDLLAWVKANLKMVIQVTVIAAVVIGGTYWFVHSRAQRHVKASQALSELRTSPGPNNAPAAKPQDFLKVAQDYPGTKAAARALLEAAGAYYIEGQYAESQKAFERLLREYPESPWRAEATLGIASTLEAQGKTPEAIAKYEEVRKNPNAAVADEAKLNLARLYEKQGRQAEAVKMFDELVRAYPYSGLGAEAGMRMEQLTNANPALATNIVPPAPPASAMTMLTNRIGTNRMSLTNLQNRMVTNTIMTMTNVRPSATSTVPLRIPTPVPQSSTGTNVAK